MRRHSGHNLKRLTLISCVLGITTALTLADEQKSQENKEKLKSAFPALDILPEGSILQRVRLPRYDKDFNPTSLLTADKLTVVDSHRIDGKNVTIELYNQKGKVQAHTEMHHAIYNQKNSTLRASEAITLKGENYWAQGRGLIFHLIDKRGFLIGPAKTQFITNQPDTSSTMQLRPPLPTQSITAATAATTIRATATATLLALTPCAMAEPPAKLTPAELAELDQLTQSSEPTYKKAQQEVSSNIETEKNINTAANAKMTPFLISIGQETLITQNNTTQTLPTATDHPTTKPKPGTKTTQPNTQKTQNPKAGGQAKAPALLQIECDGGIYFDANEGILAYLKNIRLADPRFRLTCSQELKVFLDKKPAAPKATIPKPSEPKQTDIPETKNPEATGSKTDSTINPDNPKTTTTQDSKKKKDGALTDSFGDVKRIIAIGSVKLVRKDEKGKTYIASGETASYNAKSGTMILRGGFPRIQAAANQYLQAQEKGLYITVLKNGSWTTASGKWKTLTPTNLKKSKP